MRASSKVRKIPFEAPTDTKVCRLVEFTNVDTPELGKFGTKMVKKIEKIEPATPTRPEAVTSNGMFSAD